MRLATLLLAAVLLTGSEIMPAVGQVAVSTQADLKAFSVTIRRFDPAKGPDSGQDFVLPVDSPDEEHAIASTLANVVSFSSKVAHGQPLPVAFMAVRVGRR